MQGDNDSNSIKVSGWTTMSSQQDIDQLKLFLQNQGSIKAQYQNYQQCYIDVHYASSEIAQKAYDAVRRIGQIGAINLKCEILPSRSAIKKQEQENKLVKIIQQRNREQQVEMLKQLKMMVQDHPGDARNLLMLHPELVFAINYIMDDLRQHNQ